MSFAILIPARYGSSRFPGKPLALLDGKPMIQHVYDKCKESGLDTYVLTDHEEIANLFSERDVILSSEPYKNGTERCEGALRDARLSKYDNFINVQGDMPDVTPKMIEKIKYLLERGSDVATLYTDLSEENKQNPNFVKMVKAYDYALWFGRGFNYGWHHLGIYGYSRLALSKYSKLIVTPEERIEKLEQLRWIKNNFTININWIEFNGVEINTPSDLEEWNESR